LIQYSKIIQNPSYGELQKAANQGRRGTWEKLSAIKANCGIELALDECVAILNHMRRLKRSAQRAAAAQPQAANLSSTVRLNASRRIPSWNCIAREGSTGSLDELLADAASLQQLPSPSGAGSSTRHFRAARATHDCSDSESEGIDVNTWTRSGGPLMRTLSANKFVEFVQQSLDLNSFVMQTVPRELRVTAADGGSENAEFDQRESISRAGSSGGASIVVTEGDLLQPERTPDGIVLNVVKREDLALPARSHDSESLNDTSTAECVQLECPERDTDTSSAFESDDENDNGNDLRSKGDVQSDSLPVDHATENENGSEGDVHSDSLPVDHATESENGVVGSDTSPET